MPTLRIDSIDYHYLLEGPPNRPIILLIHALMSNLHMWDSTVRALNAANYQTLRFDHIGHTHRHQQTPYPNPTPPKP
jgi:pimeloyl-ACP methyl ester carboxylesterase